jgi:hypothetical protein
MDARRFGGRPPFFFAGVVDVPASYSSGDVTETTLFGVNRLFCCRVFALSSFPLGVYLGIILILINNPLNVKEYIII